MEKLLRCSIDKAELHKKKDQYVCSKCGLLYPLLQIAPQRIIPDFRCIDKFSTLNVQFNIPHFMLNRKKIDAFGVATKAKFNHCSRNELRKKYGTKLQKEILYYIEQFRSSAGENAKILDLGCGSGGNKRFLNDIGFKNVMSVDYDSSGADVLVDAHRLPFADGAFDLILTTATVEHFYNPFVAFAEMSRILRGDGVLIASGSFWESWHGRSCFHFTPDGWSVLCTTHGFDLIDLWPGWGFIPSITSHAFGMGRLKVLTYWLQMVFDWIVKKTLGEQIMIKHKLKTAGSIGIYAKKID